jgi:glycine C-acetyltransferase
VSWLVSYTEVTLEDGRRVLAFCANNYLGLSSHPRVVEAAHRALDTHGYGLSSVRFICGTQDLHRELERRIAAFTGTEDAILYAACFDANGGVFEPLLGEADAIISDELNHASIIDGIRLCKAKRWRYKNNDMADPRALPRGGGRRGLPAEADRDRWRVLDGRLDRRHALRRRVGEPSWRHGHDRRVPFARLRGAYRAWHARTARRHRAGGHHHRHARQGAGWRPRWLHRRSSARSSRLLRQRSRPYLFSNSLPPAVVGASLAVFDLLSATTELRDRLETNTVRFRTGMTAAGFEIKPGTHPIVPIMLYDERLAHDMAARLLERGIYVIGFSYPVVAKGKARIRVQLSAAHRAEMIDRAIAAFSEVGRRTRGDQGRRRALTPRGHGRSLRLRGEP